MEREDKTPQQGHQLFICHSIHLQKPWVQKAPQAFTTPRLKKPCNSNCFKDIPKSEQKHKDFGGCLVFSHPYSKDS